MRRVGVLIAMTWRDHIRLRETLPSLTFCINIFTATIVEGAMTLNRLGVGLFILSFAVSTYASDVPTAVPPHTSSQFAPEPVATSVSPISVSQVRTCPQGRGRCGR